MEYNIVGAKIILNPNCYALKLVKLAVEDLLDIFNKDFSIFVGNPEKIKQLGFTYCNDRQNIKYIMASEHQNEIARM